MFVAVLCLYDLGLFSNLVPFNALHPSSSISSYSSASSAPLFEMSLRYNIAQAPTLPHPNTTPPLSDYRLFSLALRPRLGQSKSSLLPEMSAAITVSPVGGVMFLKGFACLLEPGLRETHWDVIRTILA